MPIGILNEMQMLNQEVAPPRTLAQQTAHFLKRAWVLEESFGTGDTHALALSAALEPQARRAVATWT